MKVTILGTGALACLFGARLAPHAEVCLLGTWREGLAAMQRDGIRVELAQGAARAPVRATSDVSEAAGVDVALVLVKSWQSERAARHAAQVLNQAGIALTLQNGLGNFEILARCVGADRAALGVTTQGAALLGPGHIRYAGGGDTYLGYTAKTRDRVDEVAGLFARSGFPTHLTEALESVVWGKLVVNAGINPLTALLRVPNGELLLRPDAEALMLAAAREAASVAAARGIELPFDAGERVREVARLTAANRSSMLQDVTRGAPTEIEAINAAVVREGERLGVPTPTNEVLWRLVRAVR